MRLTIGIEPTTYCLMSNARTSVAQLLPIKRVINIIPILESWLNVPKRLFLLSTRSVTNCDLSDPQSKSITSLPKHLKV